MAPPLKLGNHRASKHTTTSSKHRRLMGASNAYRISPYSQAERIRERFFDPVKFTTYDQVERFERRLQFRANRLSLDRSNLTLDVQYSSRYDSVAQLEIENHELKSECAELRRLITHLNQRGSKEPTIASAEAPTDIALAAEMLAVINENESAALIELFERRAVSITEWIDGLGEGDAVELSNLAGRSRVALVSGGTICATEFGTAVYEWIKSETEEFLDQRCEG